MMRQNLRRQMRRNLPIKSHERTAQRGVLALPAIGANNPLLNSASTLRHPMRHVPNDTHRLLPRLHRVQQILHTRLRLLQPRVALFVQGRPLELIIVVQAGNGAAFV